MRIEILTAPGCPNAAAAKETVADCLTALGIDAPIIDRVGRYPSPTVLIDGVDVMRAETGAPTGDACRLDLPTPQGVLEAMRALGSTSRRATLDCPAADLPLDARTTTHTEGQRI